MRRLPRWCLDVSCVVLGLSCFVLGSAVDKWWVSRGYVREAGPDGRSQWVKLEGTYIAESWAKQSRAALRHWAKVSSNRTWH